MGISQYDPAAVRRQDIWRRGALRLAESSARQRIDVRRRCRRAANGDVGWFGL